MIHPVGYPKYVYFPYFSAGPELELLYAEEAIGLAKSLSWSIVQGPFWKAANTEPDTFSKDMTPGEILEQFKKENIQNGDYVYTPCFQGVYWVRTIFAQARKAAL